MSNKQIPVIPMFKGALALRFIFKSPELIYISLVQNDGSFTHGQEYTNEDRQKLRTVEPFMAFLFPDINSAMDFSASFFFYDKDKEINRKHLYNSYQNYLKTLEEQK
jgi:hypothetical protein